jgi:5,10-methenyltetrahydrofolate synthetase
MTNLLLSNLRKECIQQRILIQQDTQKYLTVKKRLNTSILIGLSELQANTSTPIQNLGFYWPIKGEPDMRDALLQWQNEQPSRTLALPVTTKSEPLSFKEWGLNTQMMPGLANIPEPQNNLPVEVDAIIAPCVAWRNENHQIWRLGYGGGYYDRTLFSYSHSQRRPWLIGVALDEQELNSSHWKIHAQDYPLDALITQSSCRISASLKSL